MLLNHPQDKDFTLQQLEEDIKAAKTKYSMNDFCFTIATVQCLVDKIRDLENENINLLINQSC
jgi:hypothetical protein